MKNKISLVGCTLLLLSTNLAYAVLFIADIEGKSETVEIQREGKILPPAFFMPLKEKDIIRITSADTKLTLLRDGRNPTILNRSNTPFTIPQQNPSQSVWDSIVAWWTDIPTPESREKAIAVFGRGDDTPGKSYPLKLLGSNPHGDNWITLETPQLYIAWEGGKAPFTIRLLDEQNNILVEHQSQIRSVLLSTKKLQVGQNYHVQVSCIDPSKSNQTRIVNLIDDRKLTIVSADKLPTDIQSLNQLSLSREAKTRLKLAYLPQIPEWHFEALQAAHSKNLEDIKKKLLIDD